MLKDRLNIALKEWAVVQRSLLEQHQLILLRKGGISEETGDFNLRAEQFLIMPTYLHETERAGDLQPCFETWLTDRTNQNPGDEFVRFECACEVEAVIETDDREALVRLMPQHIWSRQFIDGRYDWEPYKPVFVLIVRAYALPEPVILPNLRSYGGCRSWITLEEEISTSGALPSIAGELSFERRAALTRELLERPVTVREVREGDWTRC